jgi:hypothetical protein
VTNSAAFKVIEQKMVDSLLVCDLLALTQASPATPAIVFSDDSDVIPAVAMAAASSSVPVQLVRTSSEFDRPYDEQLLSIGARVAAWEAA